MKLETVIKPRRDGTVRAVGQNGQVYVFGPTAEGSVGALVCDVDDEATIAQLLRTGNFDPFDPADYDKAQSLIVDKDAAAEDDDEDEDDGDDEPSQGEDDEPVFDANSAPIESNTPPAPAQPAKKSRSKAAK